MTYAFNDDKSKNDLSDVVRNANITDVVRAADITGIFKVTEFTITANSTLANNTGTNISSMGTVTEGNGIWSASNEWMPIAIVGYRVANMYGGEVDDFYITKQSNDTFGFEGTFWNRTGQTVTPKIVGSVLLIKRSCIMFDKTNSTWDQGY